MTIKTLRRGNKEVVQFTTPSGVVGIVATGIPPEAFAGWADKLEAQLKELERQDKPRITSTKSPRRKR